MLKDLKLEEIREKLEVIEDIIENEVRPIVSPDRYDIYSALHDEIEQLEILLKQNDVI